MKRLLLLFLLFISFGIPHHIWAAEPEAHEFRKSKPNHFLPNQGQLANTNGEVASEVLYYAKSQNYTVYFRENGISYDFTENNQRKPDTSGPLNALMNEALPAGLTPTPNTQHPASTRAFRLDMNFKGVSEAIEVKGNNKTRPKYHFYQAHCPNGVTDVQGFKQLAYKDVYPGIDIQFHFKNGRLKYDLAVEANAPARDIAFQYQPAGAVDIMANGQSLMVSTPVDTLQETLPYAYQMTAGEKDSIDCTYEVKGNGTVRYELGSAYQAGSPLTIDPIVRSWSTFFGMENLESIANGPENDLYMTGYSLNGIGNFPTTAGAFQTSGQGDDDVLISRLDSGGSSLIWSTVYGGNNEDRGQGISVEGNKVAITGSADSTFPLTSGAFQDTIPKIGNASSNGIPFLVVLDTAGKQDWATAYGIEDTTNFGGYNDGGQDVEIDGDLIAFTGKIDTDSFPLTANAYQNSCVTCGGFGTGDAFLVVFDTAGNRDYATFFGGSSGSASFNESEGNSVSISQDGYIGFGGYTNETSFPTKNAYQSSLAGNEDGFLAIFDSQYNLVLSTYLGGEDDDRIQSVDFQNNELYFGGWSDVLGSLVNDTFPTTNGAYQTTVKDDEEGVLGKMDTAGSLIWSTFVAGSKDDRIQAIKANGEQGLIYYAGYSLSNDFPVSKTAYQTNRNTSGSIFDDDVIFGQFTLDGVFQYGSYYGGGEQDQGLTISQDNPGNVYVAGNHDAFYSGTSDTFPTTKGAYQTNPSESFAFKFSRCLFDSLSIVFKDTTYCQGDTLEASADSNYLDYKWYQPGDNEELDSTYDASFNADGNYVLRVLDSSGCAAYDTAFVNIGDSSDFQAPLVTGTRTLSDSVIRVQWTPQGSDSFFSQYNLYRKRADKSSFSLVDSISSYQDTNYKDSTVQYTDSLTHQYYLTLENLCNDSVYKGDTLTSLVLDTASSGPDSVQFTWNKPFDSFSGTYRLVKNNRQTLIATTSDTTLSLSNCQAGGNIKVAYDYQSDTGYSNQFDLKNLFTPDTPTIYEATVLNDTVTEVKWSAASAISTANSYIISRDKAGGGFQPIDTVQGRLDTLYQDSFTMPIDRSFCYRVSAVDSCGGGLSAPSTKRCVVYLEANNPGCASQINLSWNAYNGFDTVTRYSIYRQTDTGALSFLTEVDSGTTTYTDTTISRGSVYTYELRARDKDSNLLSTSNTSLDSLATPATPELESVTKLTTGNNGNVKIQWQSLTGDTLLSNYKLYYRGPGTSSFGLLKNNLPINQDSFIHQNVNTSEKDHRYYLTVVDTCAFESDSSGIHKTMDLTFEVGQLSHNLKWTSYEGWPVSGYVVQEQIGGAFQPVDSLTGTDTAFNRFPVSCNNAQTYRIKAYDSRGRISFSDTAVNTAQDTIPPEPASLDNLTYTNDTVIKLDYTGSDTLDVANYKVYRKKFGNAYQLVQTDEFNSPGSAITAYDTLNGKGRYCYYIQTTDTCGNALFSDTLCGVNLSGQAQNLANQLTWPTFQGYPVDSQFVLVQNGAGYDTLARLGFNDTSFIDDSLRCNIPRTYKLLSFESGGSRTSLSNTLTLTPFDTVPPPKVNIRNATVKNSDSIQITWDTVNDVDVAQYKVYARSGGGSFSQIATVSETNKAQLSYSHKGINPVTQQYCYKVFAVDSCQGNLSDTSEIHCPVKLNATAGNLSSELNWQAYEGYQVGDYIIQRKRNAGWQTIDTVSGTDTSYTDNNLRCNRTYDYRIKGLEQGDTTTTLSNLDQATPFDTVPPPQVNIRNATVQNSDSIQITWDTVNDVDVAQYEVYVRSGGGSFSQIATVSETNKAQLSYTHKGINPETQQYCYKVFAVDSCQGNLSDTSEIYCPVKLNTTSGNLKSELSWQAYEGYQVGDYIIERKRNAGWQTIDTVAVTDTSYTDNNLRCNRTYDYRIKGLEQGDTITTFSNVDQATPFDTVPPPQVKILNATVQNSDSIQITWDTVNDVDVAQYEVYVRSGGGSFSQIGTVSETNKAQLSYTHKGINPEMQQYCYKVFAVDSCQGNLSDTSEIHCQVKLNATAGNLRSELSWQAYEGYQVGDYIIERKRNAGWQTIDTIAGTDTSYTDNNLRCNRTYDYRIKGLEQGDTTTTLSNVDQATPFDTVPPPQVNIRNATVQNSDSIQITWDTVNDVDVAQYEVYAWSGGGSFSQIATVSETNKAQLSYTPKGINPETQQYCYKVFAVDSCQGNLSDTSEIHCPVELSGNQLNLANQLTWQGYEGYPVNEYVIERLNAGTWQRVDSLSGSDTSYIDTGLACNKTYTYRIRTKENGGLNSTSLSDTIKLTPFDTIKPQTPKINVVSVSNDTLIDVNWRPSSNDVDRYVVYRDDGSGSFTAIDTNWTREDTTYTDTFSIQIDRSYCYKVKAIDSCADNQSPLSGQHCTIYLISDTTGCQQQISLNWNKYEGFDNVQQYEIFRQKEGGSRKLLATVDSTVTSYVDSQVDFNFSYAYDIKVLDKNSAFISSSNDTTNRTFEPNTPFVQSASKLTTYPNTGKVKISWNNQQGKPKLAYQKLYYQAPDSNNFDLLKDSISFSQDSFIHENLNTKQKDHRYYLTTVDSCSNESDSAGIHKTMELEFDVGQLAHDLKWTPYEGWPVKNYLVQRRQGGVFKTLDSLPAGDTSIFKQPEPCNFQISYRIKAIDSQGNFAYSDTGINEAIDTISPNGAELRNVSVVKDSLVDITFTGADSLDIFSYDVMRKRETGNYQLAERVIFNSPGGTFKVTDTTNTRQDQLSYKVLTQDSCLNTVSSDSFTATQLEGQEQNLQNLLAWHKFDGYPLDSQFVLEKNGGNYDTLARLGNTDTSFLHDNLRCNRPHTYKVVSFEQGSNRQTLSDSIRLTPFDTLKPAAPDIQKATVQNSDSVKITWDTSKDIDVDRYEVFFASRGDGFQSLTIEKEENQQLNAFTHKTIDPDTQSFCYYVKAIDSCSDVRSLPSDTHCVIELDGKPGNLRSELNWAPYNGTEPVDSYRVQRRQSGPWQTIVTIDGSKTKYTDSQDIRCNQAYNYRIEAMWEDDSTLTSLSDTTWVTPFDTLKPAAPDIQKATVQNSDSVKITWDTSKDIDVDRYEIFFGSRGDGFQSLTIETEQNQQLNAYTHKNIDPDTQSFCYYVKAIDSCSDVRSFPSDTHCVIELDGKPGNLRSELNWAPYNGKEPVDSYRVQRRQSGPWQAIGTIDGSKTKYTDSQDIRCNQAYNYRLEAVWEDDSTLTSLSDTTWVTPFDTLKPAAPDIQKATVQNSDSVKITWDTSTDIDVNRYEIFYAGRGDGFQSLTIEKEENQQLNSFTHKTIDPDTQSFCYYVKAIDSCSDVRSLPSDTHCVIELDGKPGNLRSELNWAPYSGTEPVDSYRVQRRQSGPWQTIGTIDGSKTKYTDSQDIRCNQAYNYRLEAVWEDDSTLTSLSDTTWVTPFDTLKPAVPDLRNVTVQNSDSVEITWDTSTDIDVNQYEIFYSKQGQSFLSVRIVTQENKPQNDFVQKAINPKAESYCYYVEAIDSCSGVHSLPSDTHCVIQLEAEGGQRENHLTWWPYKGAQVDSYQVERLVGNTWQRIAAVPGTDTAYTDDSSTRCNIPYRYRIQAHWEDGNSFTSLSDSARAIPFDTVDPAKPIINAFSVIGKDSAEVTWQLSDGDVKQYELSLKVGHSAVGSWQVVDTVGVDSSYTFGNLNTLDSQYCARIVAIDSCSANRSNFSKPHCDIQLETTAGQKENYLDWEAYEGWSSVAEYYIYNKSSVNPGWQIIDTVPGTDTSYTHGKLPCNRSQYYKMEGKSASGYRAFSDSIEQTPFDTVSPDAPAINYVTVKNPDTIEGVFDTASALDLGEYVIYAKAGSQPYQAIDTITDTGQAKNQFTHTGIRPDTAQYCYRVRTIDSCAGNSSQFGDRGCPVELQGTPGNLETNLNWHPYQGFFNPTYHIQRKTTNTSWQTLGSKTDTNFKDTQSLACNVTYTYRIRTVSPSGSDTSYSDTLNLQPFDTTAPTVPQLRFASANLQDEVEVEWQWDTKSDQKYFELWRDQGNGNYTIRDTITYDSTYLDASATPGQTTHSYFVRAIDSCAADGTIGAPGNRSTPSDTDRIMVPEVETGACQPEARLSWTPYQTLPQGTDYYKIYRQQSATNNTFKQVGNSYDTSFTDTSIVDGNEYCYRMEAVDTQSGYRAFSDSICMEPFVYPDPQASEMIRATVTETGKNNGEIGLEWNRSPMSDTFARGYRLYHRTGNAQYVQIADIADLTDTTYRHSGINTADSLHHYYVRIYNLCDVEGMPSDTHRAIRLTLTNQNLSTGLNWTHYQGFNVSTYEIHRSVNGGPESVIETLNGNDRAYIDSNIRCGQTYSYEVKAYDQSGNEVVWSDSQSVTGYDTIPPDRARINRGTIVETNATDGIAELNFEPASQANRKGYIIYRSEDNSRFVPVDTVFSNSTNTINYSDSNLNTQYSILSYYIRSIDSCDNIAAPSDTHQLINLQAEAKNLANEVNWTAYEGWNDWLYELQRRTPNTNWATIARQDTGNRTFTDSTKNCDTLYYYRVKAINANTGGVSFSNYDTVTSIDQKPPQPPEPERVTVEANGHVLIEWNPSVSKDQEFDHLFRKPASNPNFEPRATNLQTTNYTDSQSNANQESISYRLRSEDSCNNVSDPSEIHTTIHLTAEAGEEQNELTWTAYEGWNVATYEVYRDGSQLTKVDGGRLSYTDVRAVCTTYHNYRVRAIKEGGEEVFSWSNTDSAQARDNTPPQAVNLTTATVIEPNKVVEVRWEASTAYDADGYELYRSGLNGNGLTPIATIEGTETTRFRDSLSNPTNQQFCYQVRVKDFCDNLSERSNSGCVMSIEGEATDGTNLLDWDNYYEWPGNIAYYEVYKKEDSSFYEQIGRTSESNYRDEDLANRVTDFCYQIEAHHSEGNETSRSFEICLKQPQIVHIPNSFTPGITEGQNDKFGPEGLYFENYEMQIFNRWGEEIFSTESGEPWDGTYEGQPAPVGIYLYSITVTGENGRRESYEGSVIVVR